MPATCVIGLQWGDEAKGKIVDLLTEHHDIVVRYQGGANAGHTVVTGGQTFKLSLIPSGIFRPQVQCVVAAGVVLNPASLLEEIDGLVARGVQVGRNLILSDRAHVIFPWHFEEDRLLNQEGAGGEALGTTLRGIGPCYRDKVGRVHAIRLGDLYRPSFRGRIDQIVRAKNQLLRGAAACGRRPAAGRRRDLCRNTRVMPSGCGPSWPTPPPTCSMPWTPASGSSSRAPRARCWTSITAPSPSSPAATAPAWACRRARACPARHLTKVIGVMKAYTTRVGGGPFPTEQDNATGQHIRDRGNEYGTVTRRPRRCGWFDAVAARYTARLGGADCPGRDAAGRAQRACRS